MIPGPKQIISCPKCDGLASYMTLVSGNTHDASFWTDGKQVTPSLPLPPTVVKCCLCADCYWLAKAKKIGTIDLMENKYGLIRRAWVNAQKVEEPTEDEYYQALEKGLAKTDEQEKDLRILAWWRRNDAFRDAPLEQTQEMSSNPVLWRKNLEALGYLLTEENDSERLMKTEVYRELGEFDLAKQILSSVDSSDAAAVVSQIRSLCDTQDTCVRELHF